MKVNMKKIALACALIGAASTAAAAEFIGQNTAQADISVTRPVSATQIEITPVMGLTTTGISYDSILAGVKANTTIASTNKVAIRWSKNMDQNDMNEDTAIIYESENPEYSIKMAIKDKDPQKRLSPEADDSNDVWLVGEDSGVIEANIVSRSFEFIQPGTYKISLDSAIYNP
ncbi:hypothetical protein [Enterobacter roggenkampii]|uniref:hypothetical protein n=1 Tax=Enterobacter roggenkampii TaxID=1812935 RepID=UPI002A7F4848|nr:hypothetical protein [Enterobacter roggenkampii]